MATIIHASSTPPWEDGGSQIEQWESGLVRITQNYLVPTADRETIAASNFPRLGLLTGITSPATDGLYIYPDPTIADMNNGFAKISVSAYGRKRGEYSFDMTYVKETVILNEISRDYYLPQYRIKWVAVEGESPVPSFLRSLRDRDVIYLVGSNESLTPYVGQRTHTYAPSPSTSYGVMQEQIFTMTNYPTAPSL